MSHSMLFFCFFCISYVLAVKSVDLETNKGLIDFWLYLKKLNIANFVNLECIAELL